MLMKTQDVSVETSIFDKHSFIPKHLEDSDILTESEKKKIAENLRCLAKKLQFETKMKLSADLEIGRHDILLEGIKNDTSRFVIKFVCKYPDIDIKSKIQLYEKLREKSKDESKNKYTQKINFLNDIKSTSENEKNIIHLKHKNIIKLLSVKEYTDKGYDVYVYEYCQHQNLYIHVNKIYNGRFFPVNTIPNWMKAMSENLMRFYAYQIIAFLDFAKKVNTSASLIHGNLTLDNILLNEAYQVKVIDFACSRFTRGQEMFRILPYEGEIDKRYQPPEYFKKEKFVDSRDAHKIDLFSFGCCLVYMATHCHLFEDIHNKADSEILSFQRSQMERIPALLQNRSPDLVKYLQRLLDILDKARITIDEAKGMKWISQNRMGIKKLEDIHVNDPHKMILELMKMDHISISISKPKNKTGSINTHQQTQASDKNNSKNYHLILQDQPTRKRKFNKKPNLTFFHKKKPTHT